MDMSSGAGDHVIAGFVLSVTPEEYEILNVMAALAPADRAAVLQIAKSLATSAVSPKVNEPKPRMSGYDFGTGRPGF